MMLNNRARFERPGIREKEWEVLSKWMGWVELRV